jgi:hypothetical protein
MMMDGVMGDGRSERKDTQRACGHTQHADGKQKGGGRTLNDKHHNLKFASFRRSSSYSG